MEKAAKQETNPDSKVGKKGITAKDVLIPFLLFQAWRMLEGMAEPAQVSAFYKEATKTLDFFSAPFTGGGGGGGHAESAHAGTH